MSLITCWSSRSILLAVQSNQNNYKNYVRFISLYIEKLSKATGGLQLTLGYAIPLFIAKLAVSTCLFEFVTSNGMPETMALKSVFKCCTMHTCQVNETQTQPSDLPHAHYRRIGILEKFFIYHPCHLELQFQSCLIFWLEYLLYIYVRSRISIIVLYTYRHILFGGDNSCLLWYPWKFSTIWF